ncbi:hypothetical protein GCM10017752_11550 [Streptomyces roseoviridis]
MTHPHDPTERPSTRDAEQYVLVTAGAVIVALTIASFWLSYAHLAEVAGQHGLGGSVVRQWAWPATVDAFIVTGELLMLRAGLKRVTDGWAIGLTVTGSVGSIALNVAGVHGSTDAPVPLLDYIVAAVPPTAALLAFGVLMRQIHQLVAPRSRHDEAPTPTTAPGTEAVVEGDRGRFQQSTAGTVEVGTAGPRERDGLNAASPVPTAALRKASATGDGPQPGTHSVPRLEHDGRVSGPRGQDEGTRERWVRAGNGPRPGARTNTMATRAAPQSSHRDTGRKPLARGDRPLHEHANPEADLDLPLPHPPPEDGRDGEGDREPHGDRPDTDGDQEARGGRPDTHGDQEPSVGPKGRRPRAPRLTEDEIIELVRPHIPEVLKRDGNEAVTRVQLRGIMREHKIPIRNDRLTPVLKRLRTPQATAARSAR